MKIEEKIYEEDWFPYDGPQDIDKFREAINHPQFKRIDLDLTIDDYYGSNCVISVYIERPETEEELQKRYTENRKRKKAAIKAAETKKKNQEERELRELKRLQKKYSKHLK